MLHDTVIREKLLETGCKEEDINIALMMRGALACVDQLIFGENKTEIYLFTNRVDTEFFAGYLEYNDSYMIFVTDIAKDFVQDYATPFYKDSAGEWKFQTASRRFEIKEACFLIALHEVRHRIQLKKKINIVRKNIGPTLPIEDVLLEKLVFVYSLEAEQNPEIWSENEFDALMIETYVACKYDELEFPKDIVEILLTSLKDN